MGCSSMHVVVIQHSSIVNWGTGYFDSDRQVVCYAEELSKHREII